MGACSSSPDGNAFVDELRRAEEMPPKGENSESTVNSVRFSMYDPCLSSSAVFAAALRKSVDPYWKGSLDESTGSEIRINECE